MNTYFDSNIENYIDRKKDILRLEHTPAEAEIAIKAIEDFFCFIKRQADNAHYFLVADNGNKNPTFCHSNFSSAYHEAIRLHQKLNGDVHICAEITKVGVSDDLPF